MKIIRALLTLIIAVSATGLFAQTTGYVPGEFQSSNPYYPKPNPFYFEGKVDWFNLKITTPANFWEFLQRGIHKQDDLGDTAGAIADYTTALNGNSLKNNTCQIVTSASFVNGKLPSTLTPAPCMFTIRLRLGYLFRETDPDQAIALFKEVLQIDPLKLDVNVLIAETYLIKAEEATDPTEKNNEYQLAIQAFQAELALSPVTPVVTAQTGDTANNAHVHWELAELYEKLGLDANAVSEYDLYLQATKWHSDVYPWRIALAQTRKQTLKARH